MQEHLKSIGVVCPLLEPLEVAKATIFGALLEALQAPTAQLVTQAPGLLCRSRAWTCVRQNGATQLGAVLEVSHVLG